MKKLFSLFLLLCLVINSLSINVFAINKDILEVEDGIYIFSFNARSTNSIEQDSTLINYDDTLYIHLYDGYYAKAIQKNINVENYENEISDLKTGTQQVIADLLSSDEQKSTIANLSVITLYEESLVKDSLENMRSSSYPVVNEQVRYERTTGSKEIKSGNNPYSDYANQVISNFASVIGSYILSLNPISNAVQTFASLFPRNYTTIKSYTNFVVEAALSEEKVVQLSWVYVADSPYLGAQTQFTTTRMYTTIRKGLSNQVTDTTGFMYYKTANYQNPAEIARLNWNNTWVERIEGYYIANIYFASLS